MYHLRVRLVPSEQAPRQAEFYLDPDELAEFRTECHDDPETGFHAEVEVWELFEHLLCNSEWEFLPDSDHAYEVSASIHYDAAGECVGYDDYYYYDHYAIRSPLADLYDNGKIVFERAIPDDD